MGTNSLESYVGQELIWTPSPTAKRTFELRSGEQALASLVQPSWWGGERVGSAREGTWNFSRAGFWRRRVEVAEVGTNQIIANLEHSGWQGNGTLVVTDGQSYLWRSGSIWGAKWSWLDSSERPLMHFHQYGTFKVRCAVTIEPAAAAEPNLSLLAITGWYLMLLAREDSAAASGATVAAIS